jgi:hypothetical protein
MVNGDCVLFNRQPSLHKMSIMGTGLHSSTFRLIVSAFCGIVGAISGYQGVVQGVLGVLVGC